jgi:hypothetical protein
MSSYARPDPATVMTATIAPMTTTTTITIPKASCIAVIVARTWPDVG